MSMKKSFTQDSDGVKQRWHIFDDFETLADTVITRLSHCASEAIAERGTFSIVLAGGTTPREIYHELPELATDWRSWFVYFGDERCLPKGADDRNDTMAQRCWLDHVSIPHQQIFSIPTERGADAGAAAYTNLLTNAPVFDLVLLGLGEDGHTASIFPDLASQHATAYAVMHAPKLPHERVTLSAQRLSEARDVWFLVSGEGKRDALQKLQSGASIPAAAIKPVGGIDIFTDVF